jgi:hypothetical protein
MHSKKRNQALGNAESQACHAGLQARLASATYMHICTCLHACKPMPYALQGSHHNPKTLQKLHRGQQHSLHGLKDYHNTG